MQRYYTSLSFLNSRFYSESELDNVAFGGFPFLINQFIYYLLMIPVSWILPCCGLCVMIDVVTK